jgi:Ca2+-binding EF-hand superfamily protein
MRSREDIPVSHAESVFTQEELCDLEKIFCSIIGSRTIGPESEATTTQFRRSLRKAGLKDEGFLESVMRCVDSNHSGTFSFEEFAHAKAMAEDRIRDPVEVTEVRTFFNLIDIDGNGNISLFEIDALLTSMGVRMDHHQQKMLMATGDTGDHDGQISFDEFFHALHVLRHLPECMFAVALIKKQIYLLQKEVRVSACTRVRTRVSVLRFVSA